MNHIIDPEWTQLSKPDEASLTVEILMNMTTAWMRRFASQGQTGTDWAYNNVAYQKLKEALDRSNRPRTQHATPAMVI